MGCITVRTSTVRYRTVLHGTIPVVSVGSALSVGSAAGDERGRSPSPSPRQGSGQGDNTRPRGILLIILYRTGTDFRSLLCKGAVRVYSYEYVTVRHRTCWHLYDYVSGIQDVRIYQTTYNDHRGAGYRYYEQGERYEYDQGVLDFKFQSLHHHSL